MPVYRTLSLILPLFMLAFASQWLRAERPDLTPLQDARIEAQLAGSKNLPVLLMFSTEGCPYCELLKEEFLIPMLISGDYTDKVIIREVHISEYDQVIDFSGQSLSMDDFSQHYGVTLFPTMVLIDARGNKLVNNIVGITTPSLFGGIIDDNIDKALAFTRRQLPAH